MLVVGLTGSIGMGKTTTAEMFRRAGAPVHDSDAAVHELYATSAVAPIATEFPGAIVNNVVDRQILAKAVLSDPAALRRLEGIVHPLVSMHRETFLQNARNAGCQFAIADIPLLFETGADRLVDIIVVVTASSSVQKERVMARPGMTNEKFHAILSRQTPDSEKRRKAHWLIDTSFGYEAAQRQVAGLMRALSR